jgi:5-methylthioribose kinase
VGESAAMTPGVQPKAEFRGAVARLLGVSASTLTFTGLSGGVSSDIWRVDTADASYCAKCALPRLKVTALWEAPTARNAEEVRWLRTVRPWIGERAAEVIAADEQRGIAVLAWYDPQRWRNWKVELLSGRVNIELAERLGSLLGTIAHQAAEQPDLARSFDNRTLFDALRIDPFFRHLLPSHPAVAALVSELEQPGTTLIHGDFSPKNILVDDSGDIRVLDAECATWGCAGFDPGYLLAHLLLKLEHTGNRALLAAARAFWKCYLLEAQLPPRMQNQTDLLLKEQDLERQASLTLSGMLLARVDGKSTVHYLTGAQQRSVRARALSLLSQPPSAVTTLLNDWLAF